MKGEIQLIIFLEKIGILEKALINEKSNIIWKNTKLITNVYFIRHAEPDYSVHDDEIRPLTAKGELDAKKVANYFNDKKMDLLLSSPYKRAVDTIKPYANISGLNIETIYDFRERKVADTWIEDFQAFAKKQWTDFDYRLLDGENLNEVQNRNIVALKKVVENNVGKNIMVASHGTSLSTIINYYDKSFGYDDFDKIRNLMPWVVKFTFDDLTLNLIEEIKL